MSAFIVHDEHLNYLVSFASDKRTTYWDGEKRVDVYGNEQDIFSKLNRANVESVNARYNENEPPMPSKFVWRADTEPVQILKACACFDYQACEVSNYENTEAAKIVQEIRMDAIRSLGGYEAAEWDINKPSKRKVIRLSDLCR